MLIIPLRYLVWCDFCRCAKLDAWPTPARVTYPFAVHVSKSVRLSSPSSMINPLCTQHNRSSVKGNGTSSGNTIIMVVSKRAWLYGFFRFIDSKSQTGVFRMICHQKRTIQQSSRLELCSWFIPLVFLLNSIIPMLFSPESIMIYSRYQRQDL